MTIQEIEHQFLNISLADRAAIVQRLTKTLSKKGKGITKTAGVCGGEACIAGTRIAVWLLVEAQQLGITEAQLLQDYPHITAADLVNAWTYAEAYPEEIAAVILANNDSDRPRMATRINEAIATQDSLQGKLIRVVRPSR
jgi:uncharacterized protein (DUF433 family)